MPRPLIFACEEALRLIAECEPPRVQVLLPRPAALSQGEMTLRCEQAVRNYDPCISCATHFLRLNLERE